MPAILHDPTLSAKFAPFIDPAAADRFLQANGGRGFGGIRIEDDVLCTADGTEVLTADIPKERKDVEAAVGTAG